MVVVIMILIHSWLLKLLLFQFRKSWECSLLMNRKKSVARKNLVNYDVLESRDSNKWKENWRLFKSLVAKGVGITTTCSCF
jgi:hypothetical protein